MVQFRLCPLDRAEASIESLACWELTSFFLGSSAPLDIDLDREQAVDWYIRNEVPSNDRSDYSNEPQIAEDEMLDRFETSLVELVAVRQEVLGENYPFTIDSGRILSRKSDERITIAGLSYLTLQFYRAARGGLVEFAGDTDADAREGKRIFRDTFEKSFELIASYAVSIHKAGVPHLLSDCRGYLRLHSRLEKICKRLGAGQVLPHQQWNVIQRAANDGGVDCVVHVGAPNMPGNAHLLLLGATVQEDRIDRKIMGPEALEKFSRFFVEKPAGFQGALARPQDEDALTKAKCVDKDCLLYSYEEILNCLGRMPAENLTKTREYTFLVSSIHRILSELKGAIYIHNYDKHQAFQN